ncbi:hypothetical protein AB0O76_09525 [Streptomyces sp. NPDC086554]|uniref:hypothetical protein n=1 Tax=Streptomyces sp. NPDC086554 TaxID=3154864 RepID=UPI0034244F4A
MTSAAVVLPDAAVRLVRAVAGRRALQVVLLLAGLLALGFLCGERAQAADGMPAPDRVESTRSADTAVREGSAAAAGRDGSAEPVRKTARAAHTTVRKAPGELAAGARAGVDDAEPVVRGVHDVAVHGVVRPVADEVTGLLGGAPERGLPQMPELPRPGTGTGTGLGDGEDADGGTGPDAPDGAADSRGGRSEASARAYEGSKSHGERAESSDGAGDAYAYSVGLLTRGDGSWGGDASGSTHHPGQRPLPVPGDPARTLGGPSAGDGSSTRHGDPCAASGDSRAPVRLLAGAGSSQGSASIRDRHRDIPEFPG